MDKIGRSSSAEASLLKTGGETLCHVVTASIPWYWSHREDYCLQVSGRLGKVIFKNNLLKMKPSLLLKRHLSLHGGTCQSGNGPLCVFV